TTAARGETWAYLPLSLLVAVTDHDRPGEILEGEDLTASLPRRLGLSGVIEREIKNYEQAARRGRGVPAADVANLIRLVLRRPDAEAILRDTGSRVAQEFVRRKSLARRLAPSLPARAALSLARRAARRLLRRIVVDGDVEVTGKPAVVRVRSELARTDTTSTTCVLYAAALEEIVGSYVRERPRVEQRRCASHGAPCCEWIIAEA
ncbi:MAG TPA: hypothetical protein VF832_08535, partial [Longimicrobiales bacterium]